jgi:hypothetical protein
MTTSVPVTLKDDLKRVRQVYAAALDRDPEERDAYLDRACLGDPELRAKVAELIARHSGDFNEAPSLDTVAPRARSPLSAEDSQPVAEGRVIGPYIVRRELGRGGMGVVYLADDTRLSRRVALKSITPGLDRAVGGRERLRLEARAAAGLSHPGIATVYALEEIDNQLYLACEYVPGEPLRALLKSGPLPLNQVVAIGGQLARALAAAHTQGIVHRDIKPENVVKTPSGVIKVLDFGLARIESDGQAKLTQTGVILGTPAYLAPEQAQGQAVDFRTDIFALGLVIYELASGVNPFVAPTVTATIARIVETEPAPLSTLMPESLPDLDQIVALCLAKRPADRYKSTQDLVADFERLESDLTMRRHRSSQPAPPAALGAGSQSALWWWQFHQVAMSALYTAMMFPTWYVQRWIGAGGIVFLLSVLAAAAWATSLRLHFGFLARHAAGELAAQRRRTLPWLRAADAAFALSQVVGALIIAPGHPEFAMLFVTIAVVTLAASLVIEPATARAAFPSEAAPANQPRGSAP